MSNSLTKGIRTGVVANAFVPQGGNVGGKGFNIIYARRGEQPSTVQMASGRTLDLQPGERMVYDPTVGTINVLNAPKIVPRF